MNTMRSFLVLGLSVFAMHSVAIADGGLGQEADENALDLSQGRAKMASSVAVQDETAARKAEPMTLERADGETLAEAVGHYAKAKSLLIAAVREFDTATTLARPDAVLNSAQWRFDLVSRAEELNHILAPQPRVTKGGVKFNADSRLLNTEAKTK